jgi:hypothetical protein
MVLDMSWMEKVTSLGPSSGGGTQADRKLDKIEEYTLKSDYNATLRYHSTDESLILITRLLLLPRRRQRPLTLGLLECNGGDPRRHAFDSDLVCGTIRDGADGLARIRRSAVLLNIFLVVHIEQSVDTISIVHDWTVRHLLFGHYRAFLQVGSKALVEFGPELLARIVGVADVEPALR